MHYKLQKILLEKRALPTSSNNTLDEIYNIFLDRNTWTLEQLNEMPLRRPGTPMPFQSQSTYELMQRFIECYKDVVGDTLTKQDLIYLDLSNLIQLYSKVKSEAKTDGSNESQKEIQQASTNDLIKFFNKKSDSRGKTDDKNKPSDTSSTTRSIDGLVKTSHESESSSHVRTVDQATNITPVELVSGEIVTGANAKTGNESGAQVGTESKVIIQESPADLSGWQSISTSKLTDRENDEELDHDSRSNDGAADLSDSEKSDDEENSEGATGHTSHVHGKSPSSSKRVTVELLEEQTTSLPGQSSRQDIEKDPLDSLIKDVFQEFYKDNEIKLSHVDKTFSVAAECKTKDGFERNGIIEVQASNDGTEGKVKLKDFNFPSESANGKQNPNLVAALIYMKKRAEQLKKTNPDGKIEFHLSKKILAQLSNGKYAQYLEGDSFTIRDYQPPANRAKAGVGLFDHSGHSDNSALQASTPVPRPVAGNTPPTE